MKRFGFVFCFILISTNSYAGDIVNKWITAMMKNGQGLNEIITPDFQYTQYSFEFKDRLYHGKKGDVPFFAKQSKPTEIEVEEIDAAPGGQIAILRANADDGLYREWEIRLFITPSGISRVSEIATEGTFEGYPPGCPMTVFKRDIVVTLHGSPDGFSGQKEIKLYKFRRETDTWDYAHPGVDEKMFKYCSPRPDTFLIESEVAIFGMDGQIESANTVAAKHKAEKQERAFGAEFFEEDGINFPGRLFDIGGGKEGLLLTFTVERGKGNNVEIIDPAKLFVKKGSGWKSIWDFDAGSGTLSGFLGDLTNRAGWSIRSTQGATGPAILARLETNEDKMFNCPVGTSIIFNKSGSGFKPLKNGAPGACLKKHNIGDSALRAHVKSDTGPTYHGKVEEIDWRFQR